LLILYAKTIVSAPQEIECSLALNDVRRWIPGNVSKVFALRKRIVLATLAKNVFAPIRA
jgi:hypothetical protein